MVTIFIVMDDGVLNFHGWKQNENVSMDSVRETGGYTKEIKTWCLHIKSPVLDTAE